jgi:hypothetical protein
MRRARVEDIGCTWIRVAVSSGWPIYLDRDNASGEAAAMLAGAKTATGRAMCRAAVYAVKRWEAGQ